MVLATGFEPAMGLLRRITKPLPSAVQPSQHLTIYMVPLSRIELEPIPYQRIVLPLYYRGGVGADRETRTPTVARWYLKPVRLPISPYPR